MPPSAPTTTTILTAICANSLAIIKKLLARKEATRPDYLTSAEFHQGMDTLRQAIDALGDRIEARLFTLSQKIETSTSTIQARLESAIARLDERTETKS